ncbi:hypothetical protein ACIP86_00285 [Pseudomonas neuropathica]
MSIDKATELVTTRSEENTNLRLRVGWTPLLVADRQEGACQWLLVGADGELTQFPKMSLIQLDPLKHIA